MMKPCLKCGRPTGSSNGKCGNRAAVRCAQLSKTPVEYVLPVKQKRTALPEVKWRKVEGGVPKSGVPESYVERFTFLADALGMDGKAMLEEQAKELYERMRRAARSELDGSLFNPPPVVRAMEKPKMKVTRAVRPEVDLGEAPPVTLPQAEYFHEDLETAGEAETAHQD